MSFKPEEVYIEGKDVSWDDVGEGVRRRILGYDDQLMLVAVTFKRGSIGPIHSHPHRQVTYVESGSFEVYIGDTKKVLKSGDCFFIPPNVKHGVTALEEGSLVDVFTPTREDFIPAAIKARKA